MSRLRLSRSMFGLRFVCGATSLSGGRGWYVLFQLLPVLLACSAADRGEARQSTGNTGNRFRRIQRKRLTISGDTSGR